MWDKDYFVQDYSKETRKVHNKTYELYTTKSLTSKTLKEVKTTGPSLETIHYQCKTYTPKFHSKQARVLWERKEYEISSSTKPNSKTQKPTTKNSQHVADNK